MSKLTALLSLVAAPVLLAACTSDDDGLPTDPPTTITRVAHGGFTAPTDAVASPDGATFYFAARDGAGAPAIFGVASTPASQARALVTGAPLTAPTGLVLSCDGATLYVADPAGVFALSTAGGALTPVAAAGVARPLGLAMGPDCATLFATGRTDDDAPALFAIPAAGGDVRIVHRGGPLVSPTGLHVDPVGVSWVMDAAAEAAGGTGVLFAVAEDGRTVTPVLGGLDMGTPGGVSLVAGGGTAVIPTRDALGKGQLTTVVIATGELQQVPAPEVLEPAGIRTARAAGVFALVDAAGDAIYRAE